VISTKQKWQSDEGQIKAHKYFGDIKEVKLTWAELLFNNGKVDLYDNNADRKEYSCHLELESMK
jgi:hypothetical protein